MKKCRWRYVGIVILLVIAGITTYLSWRRCCTSKVEEEVLAAGSVAGDELVHREEIDGQKTKVYEIKASNGNELQVAVVEDPEDAMDGSISRVTLCDSENQVLLNLDVVGFYQEIRVNEKCSQAAIMYSGREWSDFIVIDLEHAAVLRSETPFDEMKAQTDADGKQMNFQPNENAAMPQISFLGWLGTDKIQLRYRVTDDQDRIQSGVMEYDVKQQKYRLIQEEEPYQEG